MIFLRIPQYIWREYICLPSKCKKETHFSNETKLLIFKLIINILSLCLQLLLRDWHMAGGYGVHRAWIMVYYLRKIETYICQFLVLFVFKCTMTWLSLLGCEKHKICWMKLFVWRGMVVDEILMNHQSLDVFSNISNNILERDKTSEKTTTLGNVDI